MHIPNTFKQMSYNHCMLPEISNQPSTTCLYILLSWWRHQMEIFSALLAICAGNSPVTGEFPTQRPVTRTFDVFFELCPNERLSKQLWGWWFGTLSSPLWRHRNDSMYSPYNHDGACRPAAIAGAIGYSGMYQTLDELQWLKIGQIGQ